jgi:hypothetical protein
MSLLHPSSVGAPVALWLSNGAPARLVHNATRYRVVGEPEAIAEGWIVSARDAAGRTSRFELHAIPGGWELRSAH